jgi:hypothetical protein
VREEESAEGQSPLVAAAMSGVDMAALGYVARRPVREEESAEGQSPLVAAAMSGVDMAALGYVARRRLSPQPASRVDLVGSRGRWKGPHPRPDQLIPFQLNPLPCYGVFTRAAAELVPATWVVG